MYRRNAPKEGWLGPKVGQMLCQKRQGLRRNPVERVEPPLLGSDEAGFATQSQIVRNRWLLAVDQSSDVTHAHPSTDLSQDVHDLDAYRMSQCFQNTGEPVGRLRLQHRNSSRSAARGA